jgi:hypothetical protein
MSVVAASFRRALEERARARFGHEHGGRYGAAYSVLAKPLHPPRMWSTRPRERTGALDRRGNLIAERFVY